MPTREELLKQARRKMLIEKAKEKMASSQEMPVEAPAQGIPETSPSGGFLGADLAPLAGTDSKENVLNALGSAGSFLEAAGQSLPVVGPMLEKGGAALAGMSPEEYEGYKQNQQEQNPIATTAGGLAGTMAGFGLAPQSIPAQLGLSAADMATRGALDDKPLEQNLEEGATNLGLEAGLMAAVPAVGKGLGKVSEKLSGMLGKGAERHAEKAAGLDMSKKLRDLLAKMEDTGAIKEGEIGRQLLDSGVVNPFQSARTTSQLAKQEKLKAGKEIGSILSEGADVSTADIADRIRAGLPDTTVLSRLQQKLVNDMNQSISIIEEAGEKVSVADLNKAKTQVGNKVKDFLEDIDMSTDANHKVYKAMKESVESAFDEQQLERLRAANKKYQANKMAEEAALGKANTPESKLGTLAATVGVASGKPAIAGAVVGRTLWHKYGNALAAGGLERGSKIPARLAPMFMDAAEKGPQAVAALHYRLMQDDPKYRESNNKEKEGK